MVWLLNFSLHVARLKMTHELSVCLVRHSPFAVPVPNSRHPPPFPFRNAVAIGGLGGIRADGERPHRWVQRVLQRTS